MIVVTGATGTIGSQVLENLLASEEPLRVIARDASRLPASLPDRVAVVEGSSGDPDVVSRAFTGADALFWLLPPDPDAASVAAAYVEFSRPAAEAVAQAGVKRVVTISALGRGVPGNAGYVTGSLAMDDLFASTGAALRALTMPSFMDNLLRQLEPIRSQGTFYSVISGSLRLPSVAARDIAAVATRWLVDDSWSGVDSVPVLGPEDISFDDMALILAQVLGRPVRFQEIPGQAYKATFTGLSMSDAMAQGMLDMAIAKDHGLDLAVTRTPDNAVQTPTTFAQWCRNVLKPAYDATGQPG